VTGGTPLDRTVLVRRAAFLLLQGEAGEAARVLAAVRDADPNLEQFAAFVDLLTWSVPRERLYPLVRGLVDAGFVNPRSLDLLAATAIWAGRTDVARGLTDLDRLMAVAPLHGPDDPDLPLLAEELASDLRRYERPGDRSIRLGWRRNHLEAVDSPVLRRMFDRLWGATRDYLGRLPVDPADPFLRARPAALEMRAWSVVSGADTHHLPHLHATSWINGVYYVAVPDVVADAERRPGWLRVGPDVARGFGAADGWDERWIRPEPGLVVLMPSHFSHETVPLGQDARRICVAFELHAVEEGAAREGGPTG